MLLMARGEVKLKHYKIRIKAVYLSMNDKKKSTVGMFCVWV